MTRNQVPLRSDAEIEMARRAGALAADVLRMIKIGRAHV